MQNTLFYGDNLHVLREHIADESVDLIYLDPPFNSKRDYNVLFREASGEAPASQQTAFTDTWQYNVEAARTREEIGDISLQYGVPKLPQMIDGFIDVLGQNDVTAYLVMMAIRLLELKRVLKPTGSFYLHCDPTASHYLKIILDVVFGKNRFQNEIIWSYRRWPSPSNHFQRMHDVILFYSKSKDGPSTFNVDYEGNSESYIKRFKGKTQILDPETRTRKITSEDDSKGLARRDVWELSILAGVSKERLGYPTQKPEALLERIIKASSNEGDVVLDPFCGCGTALSVAHRLNRRWMGIDVTHLAIAAIESRLKGQYELKAKTDYEVVGVPADLSSAFNLFQRDAYQFQYWALTLVPASPAGGEKKKGADAGIDGLVHFKDAGIAGTTIKTQTIIVQVKGGTNVSVQHIRDLRGVIERDKAAMGFYICLAPPTKPMLQEAVAAGFYKSELRGKSYPRLQIRTVEELLNGQTFDYPHHEAAAWKQAARAVEDGGQTSLTLDE